MADGLLTKYRIVYQLATFQINIRGGIVFCIRLLNEHNVNKLPGTI